MNTDPQSTSENPTVEVVPDTSALTTTDPTPSVSDPITAEMQALLNAIQTKAIEEAQKAGEFARENYLYAIRNARQQVENLNLVDPNRIESAIKQLQNDAEKDWEGVITQVNDFGDRLNEAAKAAWEILTQQDNSKF